MAERKSFVFYKDWRDAIKDLPDDVRLELYDCIMEYAFMGKLGGLKPMVSIAFNFIKPNIDRDAQKYMSVLDRNKSNGSKGGRPKKVIEEGSDNPQKPSGFSKNPKNLDNDNDNDNEDNKIPNAIALATKAGDCAGVDPGLPEKPKTWREDFEVYKADLDSAYQSLLNDESFASGRLKFYKHLDVRLSLEKAYADYWSTEAGWKKKKASRSKDLNWKKTFINALDIKSNRVYTSSGAYTPETDTQIRFTQYLRENAPMMLNMPVQPTDKEIELLREFPNNTLLAVVRQIDNNRYLTNGRNSVYQTIMEVINKNNQQ